MYIPHYKIKKKQNKINPKVAKGREKNKKQKSMTFKLEKYRKSV